jgi:hypothetical protein
LIDIFFKVEKGRIVSGKAYSDCLVPDLIDFINYELDSKCYEYSKSGLELMCDILFDKFAGDEKVQSMIKDVEKWVISEL